MTKIIQYAAFKRNMMVQANELRVGNWLLFEGKEVQVESIDPLHEHKDDEVHWKGTISIKEYLFNDSRCTGYISKWMHKFTPIPLTPAILVKCGFTPQYKRDSVFGNKLINFKMGGVHVFFSDGELKYVQIYSCTKKHIKYLHQLQNLSFALKGMELSVIL